MATKAEILALLDARSAWRSAEKEDISVGEETEGKLREYHMDAIVETKPGKYAQQRESLFVVDEGKVTEEAFPVDPERKRVPLIQAADLVVADGVKTERPRINIDVVDELHRVAIVTARQVDTLTAELSTVRYILMATGTGAPVLMEMMEEVARE